MRNINVLISELEFKKYGFKSTEIAFSELIDVISRELSLQRLKESIKLAEKYGISTMTMDEITDEVKAVRDNAKDNN
ncbi:hypothetical protein BH23BAC1_BH23BAC1_50770 [soil metagenome]|jgi:hypothetical protein